MSVAAIGSSSTAPGAPANDSWMAIRRLPQPQKYVKTKKLLSKPEVLLCIFSKLTPLELLQMGWVNHDWRSISSDNSLWKTHYVAERPPPAVEPTQEGAYKSMYLAILFPRPQPNWANAKYIMSSYGGLRRDDPKPVHRLPVTCMQFDSTKIVTGSADCTIRLFDIDSGDCFLTLVGHQAEVTCLQMDSEKVISGSMDRTLRLWDFRTSKHVGGGRCSHMTERGRGDCCRNALCPTAKAGPSRRYNVRNTFPCEGTACTCGHVVKLNMTSKDFGLQEKASSVQFGESVGSGHSAGVTCLRFDGSRLLSGSYDETVKLWDLTDLRCSNTISLVNPRDVDKGIGSDPQCVCQLCADSRESYAPPCPNTCTCCVHGTVPLSIAMDAQIAAIGCCDGSIKLFDFRASPMRQHQLNGAHTGGVHLLQFHGSNTIISGSRDGTVRKWDLASKDFDSEEPQSAPICEELPPFSSMYYDNHKLILTHNDRLQIRSPQFSNNDMLSTIPGCYSNLQLNGQYMMASYRHGVRSWKAVLDTSKNLDGTPIDPVVEAPEAAPEPAAQPPPASAAVAAQRFARAARNPRA